MLAEGKGSDAVDLIEAELLRLQKGDAGSLARLADTARTAAAIQLSTANPARALDHAQAALAASTRAERDPQASAHVGHARLLMAQAHRARGVATGARDEATRAVGPLTRGLGSDHPLTRQARTLAGAPWPRPPSSWGRAAHAVGSARPNSIPPAAVAPLGR